MCANRSAGADNIYYHHIIFACGAAAAAASRATTVLYERQESFFRGRESFRPSERSAFGDLDVDFHRFESSQNVMADADPRFSR